MKFFASKSIRESSEENAPERVDVLGCLLSRPDPSIVLVSVSGHPRSGISLNEADDPHENPTPGAVGISIARYTSLKRQLLTDWLINEEHGCVCVPAVRVQGDRGAVRLNPTRTQLLRCGYQHLARRSRAKTCL